MTQRMKSNRARNLFTMCQVLMKGTAAINPTFPGCQAAIPERERGL